MKFRTGAAWAFAIAIAASSAAVADDWDGHRFPYPREHHERCQAAGHRLHELEVDVAAHEHRRAELRAEIEQLQHELDHDCGGWRWR